MTSTKFESIWKILKENDFQITPEINNDFLCTICHKILIDGRIGNCGCKYCSECIEHYLDGVDRFCPANMDDCKIELMNMRRNVHFDLSTNIKISKLIVKCSQKSCQYRDELRNMVDHIRICNTKPVICPFSNVGCRCDEIINTEMEAHLLSANQTHSKLLMDCIDGFRNEIQTLKNDVYELKQKNHCLEEEIKIVREKKQIADKEVRIIIERQNKKIVHLQEHIVALENVNRSSRNLQFFDKPVTDEMSTQKLEQLSQSVIDLKKDNETMVTKFNDLKMENEKHENVILELQTKTKVQSQEIEQWKHKYQSAESKYSSLATKWQLNEEILEFIETKTTNLSSKINDIEANLSKQNCGEFIWNVDKFTDKNKSARDGVNLVIYSDPFYTHKNGYKLCLRIDPDGFGSGKSTHLSLYFCIMHGVYDNILPWPFKFDVTLAIINQQTGHIHASDTAKFDNFPNPINWNKPANERNGGIGYHQFIKLEELFSNPALCQADQIFLKCSVKMPK